MSERRALDRSLGLAVRGLTGAGRPLLEALGRERAPRPLHDGERRLLFAALGPGTLALERVRVVLARSLDTWVPGEGHVARAIGDTIFIPREDLSRDERLDESDPRTLVHEACHVVQFQRGGGAYIGDSIRAQLACVLRGRPRGEAYDWRRALAAGASWAELGAEQQAKLVEDAVGRWPLGELGERALAEARAGRGWCGS